MMCSMPITTSTTPLRNKPWGIRAALASAALAFCITSCDPVGEVGLNVLDSDVPVGATYAEYPAEAATVLRDDSVGTANKDNFLAGNLLDANVGRTTTEAFLQVEPITANPSARLAAGGRIDSLVLTLGYQLFYGTADRRQQLAAYELTEAFDDAKAYYAESSLATDANPLGVAHFIPRYDTVKTTRRVLVSPWVAGDTITKKTTTTEIRLKPVRIPISNDALKQKLYEAIGTSSMNTLAAFQSVLKGIAVKPYNTQGTIVSFSPAAFDTKMVLYYKLPSPDTTRYSFSFQIGGTRTQRHFTRIRTDFTSGAKLPQLATAEEVAAAPSNDLTTYLQGGLELGTKLRIPGLQELKARKGSIVVNRAELFIPVHSYSSGVYSVPSRAFLYQLGSSNRPLKTSGEFRTVQGNGYVQTGNTNPAIVSYDANQRAYRVLITSFLDAYINDKLPDQATQALMLVPTLTGTSSLNLNRALIDAAPNRIKLKVYYSTLH